MSVIDLHRPTSLFISRCQNKYSPNQPLKIQRWKLANLETMQVLSSPKKVALRCMKILTRQLTKADIAYLCVSNFADNTMDEKKKDGLTNGLIITHHPLAGSHPQPMDWSFTILHRLHATYTCSRPETAGGGKQTTIQSRLEASNTIMVRHASSCVKKNVAPADSLTKPTSMWGKHTYYRGQIPKLWRV